MGKINKGISFAKNLFGFQKGDSNLFQGRYTDFNSGWYANVANQILVTLSIWIFQPQIDIFFEWLVTRLTRPKFKKKEDLYKNMRKYFEVHQGPNYAY